LARGARNELGNRGPRKQHEQPDADELESSAETACPRQQPQDYETQPEIVRFGERVQTRQSIREAEQTHGTREKEECARRDSGDRDDIECEAHARSIDPLGASLFDECNRSEGREKRENQGNVDRRGHAGDSTE
jgi:hypothetical protein